MKKTRLLEQFQAANVTMYAFNVYLDTPIRSAGAFIIYKIVKQRCKIDLSN